MLVPDELVDAVCVGEGEAGGFQDSCIAREGGGIARNHDDGAEVRARQLLGL